MGYTNHLEMTKVSQETFFAFVSDAEKLLTELGVKKYSTIEEADEALEQHGELSQTCAYVLFEEEGRVNELALYGPYESLNIELEMNSCFCKTAQKPYDPLVKLLMCLAVKHMGGEVSADEGEPHRENFMQEFWAQGGDNPVLVRWAEAIDMEQYVQE